MKDLIVGFDTSNYRTSAAAVTLRGDVLFNSRQLLPVKEGERGLRQSDAVFFHLKQMDAVTEGLRALDIGERVAAVAASARPRPDPDSYMPVFKVGETLGRTLADTLNVPFIATNHQAGHIRAAVHGTTLETEASFLAVHCSGGTTDLLCIRDGAIDALGGTMDLNAGQLIDRTGVAMGMEFPSGPSLERLAMTGKSGGLLGCSLAGEDLRCHFSGAETRVLQWIREETMPRENIAAEVFDLMARTIARMIRAGSRQTGIRDVLIAGGVASSGLFRKQVTARLAALDRRITPVFGEAELSGDNAVGVALTGADRIREMCEGGETYHGSRNT